MSQDRLVEAVLSRVRGSAAADGFLRLGGRSPAEEALDLVDAVPQAPRADPQHGLAHDRAAHLGVADLPLGERDRHLDDLETGLAGAPGQVDLEAVARRRD